MKLTTTQMPKLTDLQWQLLLLLYRYRCLTLELLQHVCPGVDRERLRVVMCGLQKQRWAAKTILVGGEPCYALGTRAQRLFGLHHRPGFPFSHANLIEHLGIATFCVLAGHERLLADDFCTRYPKVFERGLPRQLFCLDRHDDESLAWVIVDRATDEHTLKTKADKAIGRLMDKPEMQRLMDAGKFRVVIITATETKQARIERQFEFDSPSTAKIEVLTIPSLLSLCLSSMPP